MKLLNEFPTSFPSSAVIFNFIFRNMMQPEVRKRKETHTEAVRRVFKIMVTGWRMSFNDPVRNYRLDAEFHMSTFEGKLEDEQTRLEAKRQLAVEHLEQQQQIRQEEDRIRVILTLQ